VHSVSAADEPRQLLALGALGVAGRQLTVNGRRVCLYEYGGERDSDAVRYFAPSLSGVVVPVDVSTGSPAQDWTEFVHPDDKPWLLGLHHRAVADGLGYEALFRFAEPGRRAVWVVDRQERTDVLAELAWRGISLEVTDLVAPLDHRDRTDQPEPVPVDLQIYCVSRPATGRGTRSGDGPTGLLPLATAESEALREAVRAHRSGAIHVESAVADGTHRSTLLAWAPFGADPDDSLISLAVADRTDHTAATDARRRRLHAISAAAEGTGFHLVRGGRVRVPRDWLTRVDPRLASYSDLLDRAPGADVRRLRTARRRAFHGLEAYCETLSVDLGARIATFVEVGLPDDAGSAWDCALVPLPSTAAEHVLCELSDLARSARLDPRPQLLRSLGNASTVSDVLALLVRVGSHEAHVRRRLSMVVGDRDPGVLAEQYSHALAETAAG
jgi:hypothetical protein